MIFKGFMNMIEQNDYETLYSYFTKEMKKQISKKALKKLIQDYNRFAHQHKCFVDIGTEKYDENVWLDAFENYGVSIHVTHGKISALLFKPLYYFKDKHTTLTYQFPFNDEWFVYWGGDNELFNYHYPLETQRYAYDFIKINKDSGMSYFEDGMRCEHYYAYNTPVYAPLNGVVVDIENNIKDNRIGQTNQRQPLGNYVMIKHSTNEFSLIGHLKQHSIKVNIGDEITDNVMIGLCGNSGNSSEPHIHFQVSNQPSLLEGQSLKVNFENNRTPIKGETIRR
ncbi:peptidase M23 [Staphylococcus warneri]|uniref:M23 family metallopeptidase n=1 Tax=Staphylococcus warneri TaxID=1292 RepID=UPI000F53021C|nr:M23 family metallopeptidase [Staphylococcus warneri]RQM98126.1 peptidase M23 [Staphylococcus warneri]